jgi:hypothetical protein
MTVAVTTTIGATVAVTTTIAATVVYPNATTTGTATKPGMVGLSATIDNGMAGGRCEASPGFAHGARV